MSAAPMVQRPKSARSICWAVSDLAARYCDKVRHVLLRRGDRRHQPDQRLPVPGWRPVIEMRAGLAQIFDNAIWNLCEDRVGFDRVRDLDAGNIAKPGGA